MLIVVMATVLAHEVGLSRLAQRSRHERRASRRLRALSFYAGLALVVLSIESPIDYWASDYFFVHMVEHLLLGFFAPMLIVFGAPWIPLVFALPVRWRRSLGRFFMLSPASRVLRPMGRVLRHRWFALISLNVAMVLWHIPAAFDFAERHQWAHIWLMHASFILTGVLFWLQIIPSRPLRLTASPLWQAGAIIATNGVMFILAMSLSIFSAHSWYSTYDHVAGVTLSPFADQQLGAAILWVCGDFWAVPALVGVIRRLMNADESVSSILDRAMGRSAGPTVEAFRASRLRELPSQD